jgi:FAD/FMN-containing dehydrogenase
MKDAQAFSIFTSQGERTFIPSTLLDAFKAGLRGAMLCDGDPGYDDARRIHNGMIDRRPALIVRCAGVADVLAAVRLASDHGLRVSVRGGGHGVPGFAVCDGGLMIDLALMKGIRVDPVERTARAESGVTWGEFDPETQAFGLATTGGAARPTGIAGLTLAGGHGFLMRKHGLTCDNLLSADVVTADGRMLVASATQNEDLFWGIRGGGGNFGVVTSFEYRLHPVGPMLGGLVIYPIDQARAVFKAYHAFTETAPDEVGSLAILATLPDGTKAAVLLLAYNGPPDQGEHVLRPLRTLGTPIADTVSPISYIALQSIVEGFNPAGLRNYWKTSYVNELSDEAIDLLIERYQGVPSPQTHVVLYTLGGAVGRVADEATAVSYRNARHIALIVGMWADPEADEMNLRWIRECHAAVQLFTTTGFYVNYEADAAGDRIKDAYGAAKFQRLASIKAKHDPNNLFRLNQNIPPARE